MVTTLIIILVAVSYFNLGYLEFPPHQVYFICTAISLSNFGLYSVFVQFKWSCMCINRRYKFINSVLKQLLFHKPITSYCLLIDTKSSTTKSSFDSQLESPIFDRKHGKVSYLSHSKFVQSRIGFSKTPFFQQTLPAKDIRILSQAEIEEYAKKMNVSLLKSLISVKMWVYFFFGESTDCWDDTYFLIG